MAIRSFGAGCASTDCAPAISQTTAASATKLRPGLCPRFTLRIVAEAILTSVHVKDIHRDHALGAAALNGELNLTGYLDPLQGVCQVGEAPYRFAFDSDNHVADRPCRAVDALQPGALGRGSRHRSDDDHTLATDAGCDRLARRDDADPGCRHPARPDELGDDAVHGVDRNGEADARV